MASTGRQCASIAPSGAPQPALQAPEQGTTLSPKSRFSPYFLILVPLLIQCRKLSTDSALSGSRNPTCFLWGFAVFCSVVGVPELSLCLPPQGITVPAHLSESVSCRELGETEVCHLFSLPLVQGKAGQTCNVSSPSFLPPHIRTVGVCCHAAVGTHPEPQAKLLSTSAEV